MKSLTLAAVVVAGLSAFSDERNLLPESQLFPEARTFAAGKGASSTLALDPEWGVLTLECEMGWKDVERGDEGWKTARVPMDFRDAANRHLNPWPRVFEGLGTEPLHLVRRDFPIPRGAAKLVISFGNLGKSGSATFRNAKLWVKRLRAQGPYNADIPAECPDRKPMSLDGAWKSSGTMRTRWSLNGLWQCRPALTNDAPDVVPGVDDAWGWARVPAFWSSTWRLDHFRVTDMTSAWVEDLPVEAFLPDRAWYARTFTMPREAAGKRVVVVFDCINTRALVFLDGHRAGACAYPRGEVDVTDFVKPGEEQRLVVDVTAYPLNPETLDYNAPDRATLAKSDVKSRGITDNVWLDVTPKANRFTGFHVETSVRRGEITFVGEGVEGASRYVATVKGLGEEKRFEGTTTRFTAPWKDAKLWDVHVPGNRYTVTLAAYDAEGRLVDETLPQEFGFREIEIRGRDLLLNGKVIHLRALFSPHAVAHRADVLTLAACRETCRRLRESGFNFIIAGNYSYAAGSIGHTSSLLRACDEEGILYSYTLPHVKDYGVGSFDRPEVQARYRRDVRQAIDAVRNHPCVVSWAMNHNFTGYCGDMNPVKIGGMYAPEDAVDEKTRPTRFRNRRMAHLAWTIAKEIDPTRPCYHHESGNLDDFHTVNCYLNWAPRQEKSEWPADWAARGTKPLFFVEWGMPHISTWSSWRGPEFIWRSLCWQYLQPFEGPAEIRGVAAYEDSPDMHAAIANNEAQWAKGRPMHWSSLNSRLHALSGNYHGIQAHFMEDNWRAHRAWGVSASLPWDQSGLHQRVVKTPPRQNPDRFRNLKQPGIVAPWIGDGEQFICDSNPREQWRPTEVGEVFLRWNQPSCAFIGGTPVFTDKRHVYELGDTVRKALVFLNDNREPVEYAWEVSVAEDGGTPVASAGKGKVTVAPGARADVELSFNAPAKAGRYLLQAHVVSPDADQRDAFAFSVMDKVAQAKDPEKGPRRDSSIVRALYDPVGLTAKEFDRLGVKYTRVDAITNMPGEFVYSIVGRGALTREFYLGQVVPMAAKRNPVLVFEQTKETLESIGFRVQEHGIRTSWRRFADRRLAGLDDELLRDWAGESTLVPPYTTHVEEPEVQYLREEWAGFSNTRVWRCRNRGAVATVLPEKPTVGDWRALADGGFDLDYAPLLEQKVGWGSARIVFCQFDVTARTEREPAADRLILSLVRWPGNFDGGTPAGYPIGIQAYRFRENGSSYHCWAKEPKETTRFLVSDAAAAPADLAELVEKGGVCVCVGLDAAGVRKVCPAAPACEDVKGRYFTRMRRIPAELNGLSDSRWAWHGAMDFAAFTEPSDEGNEAFRVVPHGKGRFIFMQVTPWMFDVERKPYLRSSRRHAEETLERILGNAGFPSAGGLVRYRDLPEASDDPYRYYRW